MYRISRRGFFKTGVVAGVLAATGMPTRAQTRGGTLRVGLSGGLSTDTFDARTHAGAFMIALGHGAVLDCLTEISATGELVGELAESWDASPDARIWTFSLRPGVTFHNGQLFGADDVIASYRLHLDPTRPSPATPLLSPVTEMRRLGSHQVQFVLEAGNADFPFLLADYHLAIYPAKAMAEALRDGIGTGLYRVARFEPGIGASLERVQGHYKDGRAGWFDAVELLSIPAAEDRASALRTGLVDAVDSLPPAQADQLATSPGLSVVETRGNRHFAFSMRTTAGPFSNPDLRLALKYAIDREAILSQVLLGHGSLGNDHPVGPGNPFHASGLTQASYDPDRARYHLAVAGLGDVVLPLPVSEAGFPGAVEAARLFAASTQACGISLRIEDAPSATYAAHVWRQADLAATEWSGRITEDWMFSVGYADGSLWNETGWSSPRFQSLLLQARSEFDSTRRQALYQEMQALCSGEGGQIIPVFANSLDGVSQRLFRPDAVGSVMGFDSGRLIERWSFA